MSAIYTELPDVALAESNQNVAVIVTHELNKISCADITDVSETDVVSAAVASSDGDVLSPGAVLRFYPDRWFIRS